MYYSKTAAGFFCKSIHGGDIPADSVEISDEQYILLLDGQSSGKIIEADKSGVPVLRDSILPSKRDLVDAELSTCFAQASREIEVLGDAVALGMATQSESDAYTSWRHYRVLLSRVKSDPAYPDVALPEQPKKVVL